MEFINPFLWGLLLSVLPILIHIYKLVTRKTFILPTLKIIEEDSKSKGFSINIQFIKTALRVLIIILIVLIFSQPILPTKKSNGTIFIIDTTLSSKNNFSLYINYIKEIVPSANSPIYIYDPSGNVIFGSKKEVIDKLKSYLPSVGDFTAELLKEIQDLSKNKEVIVLTDGQKEFIDKLQEANIKEFRIIKFPYSFPNGKIEFSIWKRFGNNIEIKFEIETSEECLSEILLIGKERKTLFSSVVNGRKVGEITIKGNYGFSFLKGILIKDKKTNEFIQPIYLLNNTLNTATEDNKIQNILLSLGIETGFSEITLSSRNIFNSDTTRNTIFIPSENTIKIIVRNQNILSTKKGKNQTKPIPYFSTTPINTFTNLNIPNDITLYGHIKPIAMYDEKRNNLIILGTLNYDNPDVAWFIKEAIELLLIDTKVKFVSSLQSSNIIKSNEIFYILEIPNKEISEIINTNSYENKRNNNLPTILFIILAIAMTLERLIK
ncbi:MAG: hypothetical protein N2712_06485 [Brevinematales bacterium]|nr:hypothetical protein [Brevinematales bacterium]